jgi:hypothetical protein
MVCFVSHFSHFSGLKFLAAIPTNGSWQESLEKSEIKGG